MVQFQFAGFLQPQLYNYLRSSKNSIFSEFFIQYAFSAYCIAVKGKYAISKIQYFKKKTINNKKSSEKRNKNKIVQMDN